jgi:TetR/AcrR family transcriptional regulator
LLVIKQAKRDAVTLAVTRERERNADRSRELILDAAERLFAERGYDATSLQDVGTEAGVSRGTPSYFFQSKDRLYQAVLARCFAQVRSAVQTGRERARRSGEPPEVVLAGVVGDYFDFILAHPRFVHLLEREALAGGARLSDVAPLAVREAVDAIAEELGMLGADADDARQLTLSILSLCWFPVVHTQTVLRAMGARDSNTAFLRARRQHVIDLVLQGMRNHLPSSLSAATVP